MDLLISAGIILIVGVLFILAASLVKDGGILGKIGIGIGQVVLVIAIILGLIGFVQIVL